MYKLAALSGATLAAAQASHRDLKFGYTGPVGSQCALPAGDARMLAWVEEGVMPFFTSAEFPRVLGAEGTVVEDGTYFVAFCQDDYAPDYSCVIKCDGGAIDYSMCGPGGAAGKGESFVATTCVPVRETAMNTNCNVDFASDDQVLEWPCFAEDKLGQTCRQSWKEWWQVSYDYVKAYGAQQMDKHWRSAPESDTFLPHTDANLIKLGLGMSNPDFRSSAIAPSIHGFFAEVIEDWLPRFCAATDYTGYSEDLPDEHAGGFNNASYADTCGFMGSLPDKGLSGYVDLVGTINLWTVTTSTHDIASLSAYDGPKDYNVIGPSATFDGATFNEDFPNQLIPSETFRPVGFDPSAIEGDVFWPELNAQWQCALPFVPHNQCPQMLIFAASAPTSYTLDQPVEIDYVGGIDYHPCLDLDNEPMFAQTNKECWHMHQGGPHFRTGQMAPFYPLLLDGTPDFFGVCSSPQMQKAYYVSSMTPNYPGVNYAGTEEFAASGGLQMFHGKSLGIHFCTDPSDEYNPFVCLLNMKSGFNHLSGISEQMILSPLSFGYEAITDAANNCAKYTAHYCPYDDHWMTVDNYGAVTEVRDFAAAQADCMNNGNCEPS
jgi:hypothetical protein